jgi:RNA polymerase sigma-70 factor (ECF subfamily)
MVAKNADGTLTHRGFMNTRESEDEITVKLLAAAATDEILVAAAKLGDHPAFSELWARHSNRSLQIAYRITKNREDAEDVLQEVWTKAYVHLKSFDGKARFSTWLTRIAINTALMTLRRKRVRPETLAEFIDGETWHQLEIPDKTNDVEQQYLRDERVEHLRRAICGLSPTLRHVIEIHQRDDSSIQEVATLAGLSLAATKSRLLRARTVLRAVLDPKNHRAAAPRRSTE